MPIPTEIHLNQASKLLQVSFDNGKVFSMSCEYLRVHSPSAVVRGHGVGQEQLVTEKRNIDIVRIEPVGNYAVKLVFSDGHGSGLFHWDYLYELGEQQAQKWDNYLNRLQAAGASRGQ